MIAVRDGRPVYVADVARVIDGPDEATDAVFYSVGPAKATAEHPAGSEFQAVTIALAKRPGANATRLAEQVLEKVEALRPALLPADVNVEVTRNYGETAEEKSNELVEHLLIATFSVVLLISLAMGWRAGIVVGIAVPVTLALTLFIYYVCGLHPEPRHAVRADLLHRHPGRRRHRRGREHRAPPPREEGPAAPAQSPSRRWTRSATPRSSPPSP